MHGFQPSTSKVLIQDKIRNAMFQPSTSNISMMHQEAAGFSAINIQTACATMGGDLDFLTSNIQHVIGTSSTCKLLNDHHPACY